MAREKYRFNTRGGRIFDVFNVILLSAVVAESAAKIPPL